MLGAGRLVSRREKVWEPWSGAVEGNWAGPRRFGGWPGGSECHSIRA